MQVPENHVRGVAEVVHDTLTRRYVASGVFQCWTRRRFYAACVVMG